MSKKGAILRSIRLLLLLGLWLFVAGFQATVLAQDSQPDVERWRSNLDEIAGEIATGEIDKSRAQLLRQSLDDIIAEARDVERRQRDNRGQVQNLIDNLGPAPAEGEPPETEAVAEERARLIGAQKEIAERLGRAELTESRGQALLLALSQLQQQQLRSRLTTTSPLPLLPGTWFTAIKDFFVVLDLAVAAPSTWWRSPDRPPAGDLRYWLVAAATLLAVVVAWPLNQFLRRRFGRRDMAERPSYARRILAALIDGLALGLLPAAALFALIGTLNRFEVASGLFAELVAAAVFGLVTFLVISGLVHAALAPRRPEWRIIPCSKDGAAKLARRAIALAAVISVYQAYDWIWGATEIVSPELESVSLLIVNLLGTLLLLSLLPISLWQDSNASQGSENRMLRLGRLIMILVLLAMPVLSLVGYATLANYILSRIIFFGLSIGVFLLLRATIREALAFVLLPRARSRSLAKGLVGFEDVEGRQVVFWLGLAVDLVLVVPLIWLLLRIGGASQTLISLWATQLTSDLHIGDLTIALDEIAFAIVIFALVLTGSRLLRHFLEFKLLPQTRLDAGVQHSLAAAAGYTGIVIAVLIAVATAGLDLSNLAIIAGALSVGIGFGLQAVVNNFISGLLLLIERPVKVGDWVVVGGFEGTVKRISVRATEIETFDRSAVIVPNSELITAPVTNWTHKNRMARVIIPIGVAYGSDTEVVHKVLLDLAKAHPEVLDEPAPHVIFKNFGDSSLDFQLRVFASDTDYYLTVLSDLNFAIDKAFREHGIEIPFPQRDLHIKGWPENKDENSAAASKTDPRDAFKRDRSIARDNLGDSGGDGGE
jgi:small-conductance mechanosensitive channel